MLGITSGDTATFETGISDSFTVSSVPASLNASITETGTLPSGVSLVDGNDGTAELTGVPTGPDKTYVITLRATAGTVKTTQRFTLIVN